MTERQATYFEWLILFRLYVVNFRRFAEQRNKIPIWTFEHNGDDDNYDVTNCLPTAAAAAAAAAAAKAFKAAQAVIAAKAVVVVRRICTFSCIDLI